MLQSDRAVDWGWSWAGGGSGGSEPRGGGGDGGGWNETNCCPVLQCPFDGPSCGVHSPFLDVQTTEQQHVDAGRSCPQTCLHCCYLVHLFHCRGSFHSSCYLWSCCYCSSYDFPQPVEVLPLCGSVKDFPPAFACSQQSSCLEPGLGRVGELSCEYHFDPR